MLLDCQEKVSPKEKKWRKSHFWKEMKFKPELNFSRLCENLRERSQETTSRKLLCDVLRSFMGYVAVNSFMSLYMKAVFNIFWVFYSSWQNKHWGNSLYSTLLEFTQSLSYLVDGHLFVCSLRGGVIPLWLFRVSLFQYKEKTVKYKV